MSIWDWIVMGGTILGIVVYGIWKSRGSQDMRGYLLSGNELKWWTIGLSIMATQASAITFLSTPGLGYGEGMRFVQFYFGLPIAMVVISMVAIPIYRRLHVFTAYEYLESRFDLKTRVLAASLFLLSRSLAAGITLVAPAMILETLLGWNINLVCVVIGGLVLLYTVTGGSRAVSKTQQQQMAVMLTGMAIAGVLMVWKLPAAVSLGDALHLAGSAGRLQTLTLPSDFRTFVEDRYNILSGLVAGTFLALSYFGTDQSQVQRYLGGRSATEIRMGLLFNGMFKVPMQFGILLIGVLLYVFYQFAPAPMFFNERVRSEVLSGSGAAEYQALEQRYDSLGRAKAAHWLVWAEVRDSDPARAMAAQTEARTLDTLQQGVRSAGLDLIRQQNDEANLKDQDRVFLSFVLRHMPVGLVGLLMAVILSAAMSSSSAELSSLASTSLVDIDWRLFSPRASDRRQLRASRLWTLFWGAVAITFAIIAGRFENLIEYVNILGSLFYGTILGIFVVAFFFGRIGGNAVFWAAVLAELLVAACFFLPQRLPDTFGWLDIGYLWFNLIGCLLVVVFGALFQVVQWRR
ncbi:MAG: hypothetical protein OHK0039_10850 [Bacteroidia bacterium]